MKTKSKTFQKGDDVIPDILEFVMQNIETHDYQPEGISSYNDGLTPHDPVSELKHKYVIVIKQVD